MDYRMNTLTLLLCLLFGYANSDCYGCDGAGEYCCGDYVCCYSVYLAWWFWLIILALFILKVSCIGCYIRARRRRAEMFYVQAPVPVQATVHHQPAAAPGRTAPVSHPQAPPRYPTQPPKYSPGAHAYNQPPTAPSNDSTVNKDTEMLVG